MMTRGKEREKVPLDAGSATTTSKGCPKDDPGHDNDWGYGSNPDLRVIVHALVVVVLFYRCDGVFEFRPGFIW